MSQTNKRHTDFLRFFFAAFAYLTLTPFFDSISELLESIAGKQEGIISLVIFVIFGIFNYAMYSVLYKLYNFYQSKFFEVYLRLGYRKFQSQVSEKTIQEIDFNKFIKSMIFVAIPIIGILLYMNLGLFIKPFHDPMSLRSWNFLLGLCVVAYIFYRQHSDKTILNH